MTETEVAKAQQAAPPSTTRLPPPPPFPQINHQQHQQQQSPPNPDEVRVFESVSSAELEIPLMSTLLFQPNAHYDPKQQDEKTQLINSFETHYNVILQKYGQMPQTELIESLSNGTIDLQQGENGHHLGNGFLCGLLVEPSNAEKYMNCLCKIAAADNWKNAMTSVNIVILELYPQLRQQCRQQLVYFFKEAIRKNVPSLESALVNMCRALSDGTEFRETCQVAHQFAQCLLTNRQVFTMVQPQSYFPSILFTLFSRLIVDAVHVGSTGLMSADNFKQPLLAICEYLIRERFTDLTLMGRDLVLSLMRLGWHSLLHNPTELSQNFSGIQHLLATPPPCQVLGNRVSLRISRKMADILNVHRAIYALHQQQNPAAKAQQLQLQQKLFRLYESLRTTHLSGPDSGSIRSEIIRHVWAVLDINPASNEARASFLTWLLRTANQGRELQWCKLVFFWDWYGFDQSTTQTAQIYAVPVFFTMRHLLHNGQHPMANSLVDFLIKSVNLLYQPLGYFPVSSITQAMKALESANFEVLALFSHTKLDPALRDQMRATFPDFFPKRMTSIAEILADPFYIIDFDAISPSIPTAEGKKRQDGQEIIHSEDGGSVIINWVNGRAMTMTGSIQPASTHAPPEPQRDWKAKYIEAVVATQNLGIGIGVVATQIGLVVGAAATNLILDCIIATKNAGKETLNKGISIEKAVEQRIYNAIGATQELAKNPTEKLTEHANTFLDIANTVAENIFGLPQAEEDPDSTLKDRIAYLATRIAESLKARANDYVIDPIHHQFNNVVQQLSKCLILVDYLKQRQEWTYKKVGQLSSSMIELRKEIEAKANRVKSSPGDVLLDIIRHYASKLNEQLSKMRERGAELLSTSMQKQVQAATMYVQELGNTFAKAQSIDEVKQEVVMEVKQKLNEIAQCAVTLMLRAGQHSPKAKQNGSVE